MRWKPFVVWGLLLLLAPIVSAAAKQDVYEFEVVLFERPHGGDDEFWPPEPGEPDRATAVGRLDSLPGASPTLGPVVHTLKKKGMIVHQHLSWRQIPEGRNSNSWYWVGGGRLQGLLRLSLGRYLHLDTDLLLLDADSAQPYRIRLHRRMRSGELHYVDHPKFGVLIQAEHYQADSGDGSAPDAASGEPKPAEPLGNAKQPG